MTAETVKQVMECRNLACKDDIAHKQLRGQILNPIVECLPVEINRVKILLFSIKSTAEQGRNYV